MLTSTERRLYEKEIKFLQKKNKELLARCKIAEQYQNEYEELSEELKKMKTQYQKNIKKSDRILKEYQKYIEGLDK